MSYPFDNDPDLPDAEYRDLMQATQEALDLREVDKMFEWWESHGPIQSSNN